MNFPQLGRSYGEIREGLRGIPLNGYIILYQITDDTLEILRVVHGSRNLNALFEPDEEESG
jgi:toxin ParE1/3/4